MANGKISEKVTPLLIGIGSVIMGVVLVLNPTGVALFATRLVGLVLIVMGAASVVGSLRGTSSGRFDMVAGVVEIILGVLLMAFPGTFVTWLVIIVGAFILVAGVNGLMASHAAAALGSTFATPHTIMSIFVVVLGLVVILSPFVLVDVAFAVAGVGLVVSGVLEIVAAVKE